MEAPALIPSMRILVICSLVVVMTSGAARAQEPAEPVSGLDALRAVPELSTFVELLGLGGFWPLLDGSHELTIFAPTDRAFEAFDGVDELLEPENVGALRAVLSHHLVAMPLGSEDLGLLPSVPTVSGQHVSIRALATGLRVEETGRVIRADVSFDGGVLHVVDRVLVPETGSMWDVISRDERFRILTRLLESAGLDRVLDEGDATTIFAPTDDAFLDISVDFHRTLQQSRNRNALRELLKSFMIDGERDSLEFTELNRFEASSGHMRELEIGSDGTLLDGYAVIESDIDARNGIVHVVSGFDLLNDVYIRASGELFLGLSPTQLNPDMAEQYDLRRGRGIFVSSVTRGSNAERAGLRRGDFILEIEGIEPTGAMLDEIKANHGYLGRIEMQIVRDGERRVLIVPIGLQ